MRTVRRKETSTQGAAQCQRSMLLASKRILGSAQVTSKPCTVGVWRNSGSQSSESGCPVGSEVESRTGAVTLASRWLLGAAFAAPASIRFDLAPFPVPAHRTGQAELPHPALGKDARRQGV